MNKFCVLVVVVLLFVTFAQGKRSKKANQFSLSDSEAFNCGLKCGSVFGKDPRCSRFCGSKQNLHTCASTFPDKQPKCYDYFFATSLSDDMAYSQQKLDLDCQERCKTVSAACFDTCRFNPQPCLIACVRATQKTAQCDSYCSWRSPKPYCQRFFSANECSNINGRF